MSSKPRFVGEKVRLGDVCEVVSGATPKTKNEAFWGGDIKWVTPAELDDETHYVSDTAKHLTEEGFASASLHMLPKGTVLLTTRAPIGKVAIAAADMCCNQGFKNLICSDAVNSEYLYRYLKSHSAELQAMGRGATFKELSKKNVTEYRISLPALNWQEEAVAKLEAVERQIVVARKQVEKLDQLVKSRFVEMFGSLQDGYKCGHEKLGDYAVVGSSKRVFKDELLSEGIPFYRGTEIAALSDKRPFAPELFISSDHYARLVEATGKPQVGDLLMPSICPDGQVWCVDNDEPFYFKDGRVLWVRPDRTAFEGVFLRYALSILFQMSFYSIASGTTFAELKIFLLRDLDVPMPSLEQQREFVTFAAQVDKSRFVAQQQIEKLQMLYDSLAQDYFGD